jgi:hypothetical protein
MVLLPPPRTSSSLPGLHDPPSARPPARRPQEQLDDVRKADIIAASMHHISSWLQRLGCLIVGPGLGEGQRS